MSKKIILSFFIEITNHIIVEILLNQVQGKFLVDTGASNSCFNKLNTKKFYINYIKTKERLTSATDTINEVYVSRNNELIISNFKITDFSFYLFDLSQVNDSLTNNGISPIDGVIGSDFLSKFAAKIDYSKKQITLNI